MKKRVRGNEKYIIWALRKQRISMSGAAARTGELRK